MYNPNVPSSNMGIAPISGQPSQPLGPAPMVGSAPMAPMGPPPPMAPPMMGGMPSPPMAPPIAPITEGLGGFGGSSAGRAGFSERMQRMTSPPKPKPMPQSFMNDGMHQMPDGSMMLDSDMPQPVQRMNMGGAVSSQGLSMYQPPMMPRPIGMMDGGIVSGGVKPVKMALGGFIGNESTRDYSYTDPYEELDDLYDDIGGYDPSDPFGDGDSSYGGDGDDYSDVPVVNLDPDDFGHLEPVLIGDQPPPEPASGGDDITDRVVADLIYGPADLTVGPNNAKEALDQASAEIKAGRGDVADLTLATLASRIGRGSDVMPARLSDIAAISQDFAVPAPEDTTFSDPDEIFNLKNPISLNAAQVVGPNSRTDASGNLIPGRVDTKADIEAGTEAARFEPAAPEVMSFDPSIGGSGSNLIGLGPSASELGFDDSIKSPVPVTTTLADAATFTPTLGGGFGELGGRGQLSVDEDVFSTLDPTRRRPDMLGVQPSQPNLVRAGSSARRGILGPKEDVNLGNAMAAAEAVDSGTRQNIADSFNNRSIRESEIGGRDDLARNQMLGGLLEMNTPEGEERMRAAARRAEILGMPADQQAAATGYRTTSIAEAMDAPAGDMNPFIGITDVEAAANDAGALPGGSALRTASEQELESFNKAMDDAVSPGGGLISGTSGMQSYLEKYPDGTGGTEFVAPQGTRRRSDGRTVSGIAPSPAPAVISPQNTKYLSPFDISELENAARDYRETGAGSSDFDPMAAQATAEALKRAEGDVSALDRIAEARMPTDDMQIVDDMRSVPRSSPEFAAPVGDLAQFEPQVRVASSQPATTADPDGGGTDIFDSYAALTRSMKAPNKGETNLIRNAMAGARHTEDGPGYKKGDLVVEDRFADKVLSGFETALSFLLPGPMDFKAMSQENRNKALQAYYDTGKIVYEEGKPVGFEDKEGGLVRLVPKGRDDTGQDDDCPPGFQRVNGVCVPTSRSRVAANPATAIEDAIASATLPSTLRPVVRDLVEDDEEEETSDVGGLTIRRPNYFAGGGAVSDGMGSAIDSFISAMGGSVKKKSNVAPVGMARGGYVDMRTESGGSVVDGFGNPVRTRVSTPSMSDNEKDERNFSYDPFPDDVYGRGGRGVDNDPVAPSNPNPSDFTLSGSGSYFESEPEPDNIVKRSLRPQLRPASFLNESFGDRRQRLAGGPNVFDGAGPSYDVAAGGAAGYDPYVAGELRFAREQTSPLSYIYNANTQLDKELDDQGRRPLFGGLLSKERVPGIGTVRSEIGSGGIKNAFFSFLEPIAKAFDSSRASDMGLIPKQDMLGEALGLAGVTTLGGGMLRKPVVQTSTPKPLNAAEQMAKQVLELRAQGRASEVTENMMAQADPQYMFKNTPLNMSEAARKQRLKERGFNVDETVYTGTGADNIQKFFDEPFGIFATPAPGLADSYVPRASRLAGSNDPLETAGSGSMYPLYAKKGTDIDVKGSNYGNLDLSNAPEEILDKLPEVQNPQRYGPLDASKSEYTASGLMRKISGSDPNFTGINFKNIYDYGPFGGYAQRYGYETGDSPSFIKREEERTSPQTVVARANPSDFKSVFARADPEFDHLANILAANKSKTAGLGAVSSSQTIQEMIDQLNKKAPLAEFENQKGQMVSGGLSGRELDFALNNLARRLGIERPD